MSLRPFILAYNNASSSAKALRDSLDARIIRSERSKYKAKDDHIVINWGNTSTRRQVELGIDDEQILNKPRNVRDASNKLRFFRTIREYNGNNPENPINIPQFFDDDNEAFEAFANGQALVGREVLAGHSGEGISFCDPLRDEQFVANLPLYTAYIKKRAEYRIHVMDGGVIFRQRKILNPELEAKDKTTLEWRLRNHDNGFIFQQTNVKIPTEVDAMCVRAIEAVGLDFGAIDVIWNEQENKYFVLEVNTAPGLTGNTLAAYATNFNLLLEGE